MAFAGLCLLILLSLSCIIPIFDLTHAFGETQVKNFQAQGTVTEVDMSQMKSKLVTSSNNETYFELHDWNSQSGKVLFTSGRFIGIMNPNATDVHVIALPAELDDNDVFTLSSPIGSALFSDSNTIYALVRDTLLVYKISNTSELVSVGQYHLDGDITSFDIIRQPNNNGSFNLVLAQSYHTLWLADSAGKKISKLYEAQLAPNFAVSPDGNKIAFAVREAVEGNAYLGDVRLVILNIKNKEIQEVFHETVSSTPSRIRWTANSQLLTYQQNGGVRIPLAYLYVTNTDGSYRQTLYGGVDAATSYIVSEDGGTILIGIDPYLGTGIASKLYHLELAHPIPEFSFPASLAIAAGAIGTVIVTSRALRFRQR